VKTAISIPDRVYRAAEKLAKRKGISRSELYTQAIEALVEREDDAEVTARLNRVYGRDPGHLDDALRHLPGRVVGDEPW
jgi:hypothetical protein